HHDSNADLIGNASYDTFGAGFVAETGNETGSWNNNIAIYSEGVSWGIAKNTSILNDSTFDTAKGGHGFWFQGRLIDAENNVAASVNHGYVYFHRDGDDRSIDSNTDDFKLKDAFVGQETIGSGSIPILNFTGNETFASNHGLHIVKANPDQGHDIWSRIDDFTAWEVKTGAHLEYAGHYLLSDLDLIAREDTLYNKSATGITFGKNTAEITVIDSQISGFTTGTVLTKDGNLVDEDSHNYILIDTVITGSDTDVQNFDPTLDQILSSSDLANFEPDLELDPLYLNASSLALNGTKFDTIGETEFPGGDDEIILSNESIVEQLETEGYWTTTSGDYYFTTKVYFTDRATGEVFYENHAVAMGDNISTKLQQPWWQYGGAKYNGVQDFTETDGVTYAGEQMLDVAIPVDLGTPDAPAAAIAPDDNTSVWDDLTQGQGTFDDTLPSDDLKVEDEDAQAWLTTV
ncbi:MAG: hypothetical protein AAF683_13920, partial [Pseudomonadota bacterium]